MLGLAEIELEFRAERQAAGIEVAKKKGVYRGRQKGTTKAKPQRAAELRAKGLKLDEIAQALEPAGERFSGILGIELCPDRNCGWDGALVQDLVAF